MIVYMLPGIAAAVAAMLTGAALFARQVTRQHAFFGLHNAGIFLWTSGYFLGATQTAWARGAYRSFFAEAIFLAAQFGVALASTYWFAFTAETLGVPEWVRGRRFLLAHVPGAVLVLAAVTNPWHHAFASRSGELGMITYGPLGLAALVGLYALVAATAVMYARGARKPVPVSSTTCVIMSVASAVVIAVNVLWTTRGITGLALPYNPTILLLPVTSLLIALAVLRGGMLDVLPAAESAAFRSMADGAVVLTPEGRVVALNAAAERMVPQAGRGRLLSADAPELAADVERVTAGYTDAPHGEHAWWLRAVPMQVPGGKPLGTLVLLTDLAEKRAFEQRIVELNRDLRRTVMELEAATRAKDRFIANASHELRTPLQSVIGYTQRLLFERVAPLHKAQRDELEIVERSARHLLSVIESLLDIAQLESGQLAVELTVVDAPATVRQVLDALEPLAADKGLRLRCSTDGLGGLVTDETKLRQILLNLVGNAVKFTPPDGSVHVDCAREHEWAVFRVRDSGPGIPDAEVEHVFEAFHRVRNAANPESGSGLGLHVSQVLARLLSGRIEVESVPSAGTTFTVRLPFIDERDAAPEVRD